MVPSGQNQEDAGAQPPSVHTPAEQAGFQESLQGTRRGLSGGPAEPHSRTHTRGSGLGALHSACFFPQLRSPTARREAPRSALHSTRPDGRNTGWERRGLSPPTGVTPEQTSAQPSVRVTGPRTTAGRKGQQQAKSCILSGSIEDLSLPLRGAGPESLLCTRPTGSRP